MDNKWSQAPLPLQHRTTGSHMTRLPGVRDSSEVLPGMAHYAGEGPPGATCGDCCHRSYYRKTKDDEIFRSGGCKKFHELSGSHGPPVERHWAACKYFHPMPDKRT